MIVFDLICFGGGHAAASGGAADPSQLIARGAVLIPALG
jgi:hypothetical protein